MSDPRDEETIRRWQEYTRAAGPPEDVVAGGDLPTVIAGAPDDAPPGPGGRRAPSALLLAALGLGTILVLVVGVVLFVNSSGGGPGGAQESKNGRRVDVPEANGKPAPSRDLIAGGLVRLVVQDSAPLQIGRGAEAGESITSEPENMTDGDAQTAWRMAGSGAGEKIVIRVGGSSSVDVPTPKTITQVGLINGFAKSWHYADGRKILAVRWDFGGGESLDQTLGDSEKPQMVSLPHALSTDRIEMTITGVGEAKTSSDDYTSISELRILGY